jgi:hypothetical protein
LIAPPNDGDLEESGVNKRGGKVKALLDDYPQAIVELFEKQGFIWGGTWSHFDLMHFEYCPELLQKFARDAK